MFLLLKFRLYPMKIQLAITLAAFAICIIPTAAETPTAIAADWRAKASVALEKVNTTLEKAIVPIIADLVKVGDTSGADEVKAQLKAKQDGEPVIKPHAKAATLFTLYDAARMRTLDPIRQATIRKLDAVLASADGKNLETVDAVKTLRAQVEAGKIVESQAIPVKWTYHASLDSPPLASMEIRPDGIWELYIHAKKVKEVGTWKRIDKTNVILLSYGGSSWEMVINGRKASMTRPDSGVRYLKAVGNQTF
jgi:hypothetical protein